MITLTINGLPSHCYQCKSDVEAWPVRVYAGEVIVACPHCHSRIAPVMAVPGNAK